LGADVLVAFPGETDEEHRQTFELIERLPLMMLHVFTFSPRQGTEGWDMRDRALPKEVAKERTGALKGLSAAKNRAARLRGVGETHRVLAENRRGKDGLLRGFTGNYLPVSFTGPDEAMNRIVPVTIVGLVGERLLGEAGP
jgi:threonylcarbamoyladenosine tRNA methylthiotransferase MtaB